MLKIIDLNRNEELSAAGMGKVAGGMTCDQGIEYGDALGTIADVMYASGFASVGAAYANMAMGVYVGACH
jgi:hypothetical protein